MSFGNYEQQEHIPQLIPLKKTKAILIPAATPTQKNSLSNEDVKNVLLESIKGTPTSQLNSKDDKNALPSKKQPNADKIEEIQKKAKQKISTVQKKDNQLKNIQHDKAKQNEKNKFVIAQLLHSMNIKNISEQLYPLSNEALQRLITSIEKQIEELNVEADKKQRTLAINQNNLHLKKQLETIRREIDHCCLIKQLYYEKMNYRNKIQTLEQDISGLRNQNKDLKIKVARGLEAIQNYRQNLPSDNQKELRQKLNICNQELTQQKQMRQSLQRNIQSIINNFKRLYDEAEIARQIVSKKLKQVEERQKRLRKMKQNEQDEASEQVMSPARRVASLEIAEKQKQLTSSYSDFNNNYSQTAQKKAVPIAQQDFKKSTTLKPKYGGVGTYGKQKEDKQKKTEALNHSMTLQDKIKKMRANQAAVTRIKDN